jgi:hypothetical protein
MRGVLVVTLLIALPLNLAWGGENRTKYVLIPIVTGYLGAIM